MPTIDGLHRATRRLTEPVRHAREARASRSGPGVGILLGLSVLAVLGLLLVRPSSAPEVATPSTESAEPAPSANAETPSQSLMLPSAASDTPVDDLLILDQPTDASVPQPDEKSLDLAPNQSAFSVRILNGGGRTGAAIQLKSDLVTAGYTVTSVGNARATYARTTIYYQASFQEEANDLGAALGNPAPTIEESTVAEPADILIVIGTDRS